MLLEFYWLVMRHEGGKLQFRLNQQIAWSHREKKKKIPLWQIPSNITGNNETHVQRAEKTTVGHPSVRSEAKGASRCFLSKSNPLQCFKLIDPLHWPSDSIKDLSDPPFLPLLQDPPPPANKKPLPCPCVERVSKIAAFLPPFCEMYLKIAGAQTLILRQTTRRSSNCSHQRWVAVSAFSPLLLSLKHIAAGWDHVECIFFSTTRRPLLLVLIELVRTVLICFLPRDSIFPFCCMILFVLTTLGVRAPD